MENKFINITFICITILVLVALANNLTTQNVEAISSYNNLSNSNMILTLSENFKSIKLPKIVFMFFFLFIQFVVYFQVFCKQLPVSKIIKNITVFIILEIILILYMISINNVFLMIYITFIFCVIAKIYETVKKMKNFSNNINKSSKDLSEYNQITQEEVNSIIEEAFNEIKPESMKDMGKLMGYLNPKLKGRCDMGNVSKIIREKLN